jgi:hypothetical protein
MFSSLVPTYFGVKHLCFYRKESWRILHMHLIFKVHIDDCHHGWVMIEEWSFIHFRLVNLEGWNIPHEFQLMAILLDVYGMSFMFWLVLVDCVGWLVSHLLIPLRWRKTLCALMKHKMRQLLEEQKDSAVLIFQSCIIHFQDWCFSWLVTRCRRKIFSHWRADCWRQRSSHEGLDSQWEGWQSSKCRENSGSAAAREQWLRDIASCSARHVKVPRWLSKSLFK